MGKSKSFEMLQLAAVCLPNDMDIERLRLTVQIIDSPEYTELGGRSAFREIFNKSFSRSVLLACDAAVLGKIRQSIKILPAVLTELVYSIQKGHGAKLISGDKPDFYEPAQLKQLLKKLESNSSGKNYTNIDASEFMLLFDDAVIKNPDEVFMQLPYDDSDTAASIKNVLKDKKYCISCNDIDSLKEALSADIEKKTQLINSKRIKKRSRMLFKIALSMTIGIVPVIMLLFGLLTNDWFIICESVLGVILFLYLLLG